MDEILDLQRLAQNLELLETIRRVEIDELISALIPVTDRINSLIIKNEERQKVTKERFNVFNCLTKHHLEELHSNFIFYLLNPKSSHDCGGLFLKVFFDLLRATNCFPEHSANHISEELESAIVIKELPIGRSSISDIYGFIDIFIETNNYIIAIENKIYANEQKDQIIRYSKFCRYQARNKDKTPLVLYLTIDGKESSQAGEEKYLPISYDIHIRNWLENSIKECWQYPLVYAGIYYYKELINNHILNKPSNKIVMEIKELLLQKENLAILKYLPELSSAIVPIRNQLRLDFICKVFEKLKEEGLQVSAVHRINNENVSLTDFFKEQYRGIKIKNPEITVSIDGQSLSFCIEHEYPELYFGLFGSYKNASGEEQIIHSLRNKLPRFELGRNEYWACWKIFKVNEKDFGDDRLNYDFATNLDRIVADFMTEFRLFISAWKETALELKKQEKLAVIDQN